VGFWAFWGPLGGVVAWFYYVYYVVFQVCVCLKFFCTVDRRGFVCVCFSEDWDAAVYLHDDVEVWGRGYVEGLRGVGRVVLVTLVILSREFWCGSAVDSLIF